ncbi:MAG: HAD-IIA family hydrolase [Anaerolineales bacterium]
MLQRIKALILDMDGVLWRDAQPIGDLVAIFEHIRALGLAFMLASNNATSTITAFVQRLHTFGVEIAPKQVMTSALVTATYLREHFPTGSPLFVVGEDGLREILREYGFHILADEAEAPRPVAVVAAMDREINYRRLTSATGWIRAGVPFIGTNPDRTYPTPQGLAPGAGSLLAALQAASDVEPHIMGKPYPEIYHRCLERLNCHPEEVIMVGDRIETDIQGAQRIGMRTALVLSGVTTPQQAATCHPAPNWVVDDLETLLRILDR